MSKALALASVALASVAAFNPPLPASLPCLRATDGRTSALQARHAASPTVDRRSLLLAAGAAVLSPLAPSPAWANQNEREIGDIPASGLIFKDQIKVNAFEDPKVKGVQLYITDFQRPVTERLKKDFFSDPTQASVACAQTGPITIAPDIVKSKEGEEVFEQARSLLFKSLKVRRVFDEETNTIVYISYSTRLNKDDDDNKSRFKTTSCAVHLNMNM